MGGARQARDLAVSWWAALVLFGWGTPALGQSPGSQTLVLWDRAMEAWEKGDGSRALGLLQEAYQQEPRGYVACAAGRVANELSWWGSAMWWLSRCAADPGTSSAERQGAALQVRQLSSRRGVLRLRASAGVQAVFVGGQRTPPTAELALPAGDEVVVLEDQEGRLEAAPVTIEGGKTVTLLASTTAERQYRSFWPRKSRWPLWLTLGSSLLATVGAVTAVTLEQHYWEEADLQAARRAGWASQSLSVVAGVGFAATLVLLPYLLESPSD